MPFVLIYFGVGILLATAYLLRTVVEGEGADALVSAPFLIAIWPMLLLSDWRKRDDAPRLPATPVFDPKDTPEWRALLRQVDRECALTVTEVLTPEEPPQPPVAINNIPQLQRYDPYEDYAYFAEDGVHVVTDLTDSLLAMEESKARSLQAQVTMLQHQLEQAKMEQEQDVRGLRSRLVRTRQQENMAQVRATVTPGQPAHYQKTQYLRLPGEFMDYAKSNFMTDTGEPIEDHLGMPFVRVKDEVFDYISDEWRQL